MGKQLNLKDFECQSEIDANIIDLPFHDDHLFGLNFDLEQMIVVIKIQMFNWAPVQDEKVFSPAFVKMKEENGVGPFYQSSKGRIVEIRFFCDHGKEFVPDCILMTLSTIVGHEIGAAYIQKNKSLFVLEGFESVSIKFTKYEIWDMTQEPPKEEPKSDLLCLQCYVKKGIKTPMTLIVHPDRTHFNGLCSLCKWECFNQSLEEYPKRNEFRMPPDTEMK